MSEVELKDCTCAKFDTNLRFSSPSDNFRYFGGNQRAQDTACWFKARVVRIDANYMLQPSCGYELAGWPRNSTRQEVHPKEKSFQRFFKIKCGWTRKMVCWKLFSLRPKYLCQRLPRWFLAQSDIFRYPTHGCVHFQRLAEGQWEQMLTLALQGS